MDDVHQFFSSKDNRYIPTWETALDELINLQEAGLQEAGYIRYIGLSEPTAEQLECAITIADARGTSIDSIESAYSIVTRRAEVNGVKDICDKKGITIIAYSSVIRGLTDQRLKEISSNDFDLPAEQFQSKVFNLVEITGDFARENVNMFSANNIKNNVKHMLAFQECADKYKITPSQLALSWIQYKGAIPIAVSI